MTAGTFVERSPARIEGLSTWRAMLMLMGIVFHATCWHEGHPLFQGIVLASSTFRMGCFFLISGLLGGYALRRRAPHAWLRQRIVRIGIPALFAYATITPIIGLLLDAAPPTAFIPRPIPFDWYHLWFLFALVAYAPLTLLLHRLDRTTGMVAGVERLCRILPGAQTWVLLAVALASLVPMVLVSWMLDQWTSTTYRAPLLQLRLIAGYAPVYGFGFLLARSALLRDTMIGRVTAPVAILMLIAAAYIWQFAILPMPVRAWTNATLVIGAAFGPPAAASLILRSALAIRSVPPFVQKLADASFTMYLLHYPIIVAIKIALVSATRDPGIAFMCAIPVAAILSYAAHRRIVLRSPRLGFLLNGRVLERRPARDDLSGEHDGSGGLLLPGAPRTAGTASVARFGPTALSSEIN